MVLIWSPVWTTPVVEVCNFAGVCDSRTTGGLRSWAFRMLRMYQIRREVGPNISKPFILFSSDARCELSTTFRVDYGLSTTHGGGSGSKKVGVLVLLLWLRVVRSISDQLRGAGGRYKQ
jgi:hypothetical protein